MEVNADKVYYAEVIPTHDTFEVLELKVCKKRIYDDHFVGVDKRNQRAVLVREKDMGVWAFYDIMDAIEKVQIEEEKYNDKIGE